MRHLIIAAHPRAKSFNHSVVEAAMALGTLLGGWRIVHTMGSKITLLRPVQGFCAETGGAATLFLATWLGVPVSTTHTITGAIIGVGAACRVSAFRWNIAGGIITAWVLTSPAAALIGAYFYACASSLMPPLRPRRAVDRRCGFPNNINSSREWNASNARTALPT